MRHPRSRGGLARRREARGSGVGRSVGKAMKTAAMHPLYDRIGGGYRATRREEPRIAAAITDALGDARSVINVGAGTGAYEPTDRDVLAVEPAETMIAQRPAGSAAVIQASAE